MDCPRAKFASYAALGSFYRKRKVWDSRQCNSTLRFDPSSFVHVNIPHHTSPSSEILGERNGSKRGGAHGGGENKNVGKEKGGGRGRRKKEKKKVLATEEEGSQRRQRTNMVLEKIRSGMEIPCVARGWGHYLCTHMCSCA